MKITALFFLACWIVTRPLGLFIYYFLAEPVLTFNAFCVRKMGAL